MGKGKKKGKKEEEKQVPSVAGLTISEDAPSTSQSAAAPEEKPAEKKEEPIEEEGLGLTGGGRKKPRKKKSAAAVDSAGLAQAGPVPTGPVQTGPVHAPPDLLGQPGLGDQGFVQPATGWQGPKQTTPVYVGPGQGQPGPGQPAPGQPAPGQPGPGWWAPGQPGPMQVAPGHSGQGRQGLRQPGPMQMAPGQVAPGQLGPCQPEPGRGRGIGYTHTRPGPPSAVATPTSTSRASQPPGHPGQQLPPQVQPAPAATYRPPVPTTSQEVARIAPSRLELNCRFKIPAKRLGNTVRGTPIKVLTNYLPMTFKNLKVYRYDVTMKPDRPKKMLPAVFKLVKETYYPREFIAFDQAKNCYALQPLKNVPIDGNRYTVEVQIKDVNAKLMQFQVSFKSTGVVDFMKIRQHMEGGGSSLNTPSEEIQCVDVILRQGALEAYVKCGRQFFSRPSNPIPLGGGLEIWTGLFQSAIFTSSAYINVDVAHKGFPIQQSMLSAMTNSFRIDTNRRIEDQRGRDIEVFLAFIRGLRVVATLVGPPNNGQKREFICNGLADPPYELKFPCERDGKSVTMTVLDYFLKEKGYRIKYPKLNCMWVGPKEKCIYYPMELLDIAYGQALNRQLNDLQLATMVKEAATPPYERKQKIEDAVRNMKYSTNAFFKKFGLEISDKFLEVDAKILAPPSLDVGDNRPLMPRRGVWQTNRLVKPEPLQSWGFIAIDCNPATSNFETIKDLLKSTGRQMGMEVSEPRMVQFNVRITELRNILFNALDKEVRFLFIIVATRGRDTYHKVKQLAERDVGILTQCIKEYTATRRMNPQTMKNILLKVNSKLMGINQVLDSRAMPACLKHGGVMIVGADVTHPSPDQTSIPSIAAVTASMDTKCFSYNIELSIQTPKKEMIVEFAEMMFDHLKLYRERHRALPKKIYVYRDGVSEGQFAEVLNSELTAVHRAYQRLSPNEKPEVLFLLVQKRHHTRFFTIPQCANVEPGTVVDSHIVHPKELDFYLVSHQAIKGTARPTRYHAICNDGNLAHDEIEQLTYYLCHLYSRCMRSVSYPTPTYYAHLACLRARSLTHGQTFDNKALEKQPQRLRVLDKMLQFSRMFFV